MTEPDQPCIRGCVRDCRCNACLEAPAPVHEPVPMPASDGWLCKPCSSKMRRWLETVCDDTLHLNIRIPDNYGWDHGHTHAKVSGSPALIRLDVAALTDPRTTVTVQDEVGRGKRPDPADYEENDSGILQIPAVLIQRARDLKEEHDMRTPIDTMYGAVEFLLNQWDRLTAAAWIDEMYADVAKIKQLLNAAHRYRPPAEIGPCFRCDEAVRKEEGNGEEHAVCRCGRVYEGPDLFKLHLQKNRARLDELVAEARLTVKDARDYLMLKYPQHPTPRESTIRSWISREQVAMTEAGFVDIVSMERWFTELRDQKQAIRRTPRAG